MVKEILYQKLDEAEVIEGSRVQELMEEKEPHFSLHTAYKAEIFTGKFYRIYFTNLTNSELPDALEWLKEGASELNVISLDLEWKPFKPTKPIALFQMATKDRCLVIKNDANPNETNRNAFTQFMTTNNFVGKGAGIDILKLSKFFNANFRTRILDIHNYLQKTYKNLSFINMYESLVDTPPTASFKDKKVTISNWERQIYTNKQFFYSSFDAIAAYESFITAYSRNPSLFITYDEMKLLQKEKKKGKKQNKKPKNPTEENKKQDSKTHERNPFNRKNEASDTKSYTTNEYSSTVSTDSNESIIECLAHIETIVVNLNSLIESMITA